MRRPGIVLALVVAVGVVGGVLALGLRPSAGIDTLVSPSSADYRVSQSDDRQFGSAAVVVLVRLPVSRLTQPSELERLSRLEACLGGEQLSSADGGTVLLPVAVRSATPYGGWRSPCGELMRERPVQVVYGPGTFLNHAVAAVDSQLRVLLGASAAEVRRAEALARSLARARGLSAAEVGAAVRAAGQLAAARQLTSLEQAARAAGISTVPAINNPAFVQDVVFGGGRVDGTGVPNPRFSYLFPTAAAAVIQVRLRSDLSDAGQSRAIGWIRAAVGMPRFALAGGSYLVSGEPVVLNDLAAELSGQIVLLLAGAVAVMAVVLLVVFRRRPRLLPLGIALTATAVTFGLTALVGAGLTVAGVAVLPVLIGLSVDYAIQYQSGTRRQSIVVAAVATAAGFLALLLSPVPMVRGFALLLVAGVCVAVALTLVVVPAATLLAEKFPPPGNFSASRGLGPLAPSIRGAREILADAAHRLRPPRVPAETVIDAVTARPAAVLLAGLVLASAGWALAPRTPVQSDITKLVPRGMPALRDLETLERETGVSGEIDVLVHARDVATPRAVAWMAGYERRIGAHFGSGQDGGCAAATVCPALSLPSLLAATTPEAPLTQARIDGLLGSVPSYFTRAVITPDRRYASLAFGIRLMPLARQQRVVAYMRAQLDPPPGVGAELAGLPVLAADANGSLAAPSTRLLMLLVGLLAVALVLLAALRSPRRALAPLAPIVLATGWSALVVFALRIPLNPMSATLGALVIAISTEFSVLLSERTLQERGRGLEPRAALVAAYRSTGRAVLASAVTAIAGFGVLTLSDITMLRDFGLVTLVDLGTSLIGVLVVLPAALTLAGVETRARSAAVPVR